MTPPGLPMTAMVDQGHCAISALEDYGIIYKKEWRVMLGFRVWDIRHNWFCHADNFYKNSSGDLRPHDKRFPMDQYIGMQSTGIFDRNKKEIFEGDMLFLYTTTKNYYYLVESASDFLVMYGKDKHLIEGIGNDGNIYECPALLERLK